MLGTLHRKRGLRVGAAKSRWLDACPFPLAGGLNRAQEEGVNMLQFHGFGCVVALSGQTTGLPFHRHFFMDVNEKFLPVLMFQISRFLPKASWGPFLEHLERPKTIHFERPLMCSS